FFGFSDKNLKRGAVDDGSAISIAYARTAVSRLNAENADLGSSPRKAQRRASGPDGSRMLPTPARPVRDGPNLLCFSSAAQREIGRRRSHSEEGHHLTPIRSPGVAAPLTSPQPRFYDTAVPRWRNW